MKTKSLIDIEKRIADSSTDDIRRHVLTKARDFKTSWIELGQSLYEVWKDKLYRDWDYATFDAYAIKEIGVKKQTAIKLLRSYSFLEKEEPKYIKKEFNGESDTAKIPTFETIDTLRKASANKNVDRESYMDMKRSVFEEGRDAGAIKKDLTEIIKREDEINPEAARKVKRDKTLKRFASLLRSVIREIKISKLLPANDIKSADALLDRIESEIN